MGRLVELRRGWRPSGFSYGISGRCRTRRRETRWREGRRGVAGSQGVEAVPAPAPATSAPHKGLRFRSCSWILFVLSDAGRVLEVGWFGCLAQMITAGCLAGVSDTVAQKLSGYQKIEKRRLLLKMVRTLPCI